MASDGTPARKMRRILDDDDDLPDITEPGFLKPQKAATPQFTEENAEAESDAEGLFSDDEEEGSEKEEKPSSRKKRQVCAYYYAYRFRSRDESEGEEFPREDERMDEDRRAPIVQERSLPNLPNPAPSDGNVTFIQFSSNM